MLITFINHKHGRGTFFYEYSPTFNSNRNNHNNKNRRTTLQPSKTTAINSFWDEWSATQPTDIYDNQLEAFSAHGNDHFNGLNEKLRITTPITYLRTTTRKSSLDPWLVNVLNEYSTTSKYFNPSQNNLSTRSTTQRANVVTDMPMWMREVLNEHSTTTKHGINSMPIQFETGNTRKTTFLDDNHNNGGGRGDLHLVSQNRYSM